MTCRQWATVGCASEKSTQSSADEWPSGYIVYFDRVWHVALWATTKRYNISANLIQVIKHLYDKATSAVLFNGNIGDWFRTTVSQHSDGNDVSSVSIESERGLSHLPVCLRVMDSQSRAPKKNTSYGNRVLPQDTTRLIQRPCYQ